MQKFIGLTDYIVTPILFFAIILFAYYRGKKKYKERSIQNYFVLGIFFKLLGSLTIGLINQYYFGGGDTYYHFAGAWTFTSNFFTNFQTTMNLLWQDTAYNSQYIGTYFVKVQALVRRDASLLIMKIGGVLGLFTFNTYLGTSLLFATFSFLGNWKIFKVFYDLYPNLHKKIALATLFIPTALFWGAGYGKEPIISGALGFLFYGSYMFFLKNKKTPKYFIIIIMSAYLIIKIKAYIFLSFFPALVLWIALRKKQQIRNRTLRLLSIPVLLITTLSICIIGYSSLTSIDKFEHYSLDKVGENALQLAENYEMLNTLAQEKGQGNLNNFSLGNFEPTLLGMLKKFPAAVNVTLYRPYLWETQSVINLPNTFENLILLFLTIWVILRNKVIYFFRNIFRNPDALFCLLFGISFAFVVGISTSNFGTLARYRIPCLPFFVMGLFLINMKKRILSISHKRTTKEI